MDEKIYSGVIVPLVTPFTWEGKADVVALERIVQYVTQNHCNPFVLGTTGESASIASDEFPVIASIMKNTVRDKCKTYAGISSNNFRKSVDLGKKMLDLGIDAVVAHLPYYYPLSDAQILFYYENLVESINGPLLIYNIPDTTHHSIPLNIVEKLSHHPNIVGIKDSERDKNRMRQSIDYWAERQDFVYLLGWGAEFSNSLLLGADGIVPSTGNIIPFLYHFLYKQAVAGNKTDAGYLQSITDQFSQIYQKGHSLSESLAGLKVILHELGLCEPTVLLPLTELSEDEERKIIRDINKLKIIVQRGPLGKQVKWPV